MKCVSKLNSMIFMGWNGLRDGDEGVGWFYQFSIYLLASNNLFLKEDLAQDL